MEEKAIRVGSMEEEKVNKTSSVLGKRALVAITAYMVFLTIYILGNRICILMTGYEIISDVMLATTKVLEFYRFMWIGGIIMAAYLVWVLRKKLVSIDIIFLAGYFLFLALSVVANRDLGFGSNLMESVKIGLVIVDFYLLGRAIDKAQFDYILKRVVLFGLYVWNIGCAMSLWTYFINYKGYYWFSSFNRPSRQGIMSGRLFGVFSDPNYAAFISFLFIGAIVYLYKKANSKIIRVLFVISVVVNVVYIVLSVSRSSYVTIFCSLVVASVYYTYVKNGTIFSLKSIGWAALRAAVAVGGALALYFIVLFAFQGVGYAVTPERDVETEFEREDVTEENISNSRFRIWMDYTELLKDRPLTGFSARGALEYAKKKDPNSYLADRQYNTHNMYLLAFVQTGILGAGMMIIFLAYLLIMSLKNMKKFCTNTAFALSVFWVVSSFVFYFFNVGVFTSYRFETMLFWWALGYIGGCIYDDKKSKSVGDSAGI